MKSITKYLFYLVFSTTINADTTPVEMLKSKDIELRSLINSYKSSKTNQNKQKVINTINGIFDFNTMSQKVLPKAIWDQTDTLQRTNFTKAFKRMIENSSITKLDMYLSDSIFYDSVATKASIVSVSSHIWYKGKKTTLIYKMAPVGELWKVYDLVINDFSTLRNYREQFISILQKKKLEELIVILEAKADSFITK